MYESIIMHIDLYSVQIKAIIKHVIIDDYVKINPSFFCFYVLKILKCIYIAVFLFITSGRYC